jgi:hypothetical protein
MRRSGVGEACDEDRDGEPDPRHDRDAEEPRRRRAAGQRGDAGADGEQGEREDARRLPDEQCDGGPHRDRPRPPGRVQAGERDARVRQREQRHDRERDPGMQPVDEARKGSIEILEPLLDPPNGGLVPLVVPAAADERRGVRGELAEHLVQRAPGTRGDGQAHDHARDRRVDAGAMERVPEEPARHPPGDPAPDVRAGHHGATPRHRGGGEQPLELDAGPVEEGDHEDAADVVEDRERRHEHDEGVGNAALEERQHADAEGDVRRHGNAPPRRAGAACVQGEEDAGGHEHAPERGDRREDGLRRRAELAHHELALDLHPHEEEEERHEPLVQELERGEPRDEIADPEGHGELEDEPVALGVEVRPPERRDRAAEEHEPARRLQAEEGLEGPEHGREQTGACDGHAR